MQIPEPAVRYQALLAWLGAIAARYQIEPDSLLPASSDASFRRYFRVRCADGARPSLIVMDAPPDKEDNARFIQVATLLADSGVNVPQVLEKDLAQGFLLLTDLGDTTFLRALEHHAPAALYASATDALIQFQASANASQLPPYDREQLDRELQLFPHWYIARHLGKTLTPAQQTDLTQVFEALIVNNLAQPRLFVHRDYHSRNLMMVANGQVGILDFQDALNGPITYDLASLLRDAYVRWSEEEVLDWAVRYWDKARAAGLPVAADFGEFWLDFEWMGLQRHLKVLGIFARLNYRDGKDAYLADLPLVLDYARRVAERYRPLRPLARLFDALDAKPAVVGYTF